MKYKSKQSLTNTAISEADSPDLDHHASIRRAVLCIVKDVNLFVDEEVAILSGSLDQIQSLARESVETLTVSLRNLSEQGQFQSRLLQDLASLSKDKRETTAEGVFGAG